MEPVCAARRLPSSNVNNLQHNCPRLRKFEKVMYFFLVQTVYFSSLFHQNVV